jgi:hypothetical protein
MALSSAIAVMRLRRNPYRVAELQSYRVAELRDCGVAELQRCASAISEEISGLNLIAPIRIDINEKFTPMPAVALTNGHFVYRGNI